MRNLPPASISCIAYDRRLARKELVIVEGAGHLFEEPATLDKVERQPERWFRHNLAGEGAS
jgi:putative phosphoribosyl transferase